MSEKSLEGFTDEEILQKKSSDNKQEEKHNGTYSVVLVKYPQNILFETENAPDGKTVFKLNENHPFYEKIIGPLCGDVMDGDDSWDNKEREKTKDAILLFLMSYAKAASSFPEEDQKLLDSLLAQWGTILSCVTKRMDSPTD